MKKYNSDKYIKIAIPKGRIMEELLPILSNKFGIKIEDNFFDSSNRQLIFNSNFNFLKIVIARSSDIVNFVNSAACDFGISGLDLIEESSLTDLYVIKNLDIGKCRLSFATNSRDFNIKNYNNLKIATKYKNITKNYFSSLSINTDIIKFNGSMEITPHLSICEGIVDLVSSGNSLKADNLFEHFSILDISSHLIMNKSSFKLKYPLTRKVIDLFNK